MQGGQLSIRTVLVLLFVFAGAVYKALKSYYLWFSEILSVSAWHHQIEVYRPGIGIGSGSGIGISYV